jgi:hypothetical protein
MPDPTPTPAPGAPGVASNAQAAAQAREAVNAIDQAAAAKPAPAATAAGVTANQGGESIAQVMERLNKLEADNAELRQRLGSRQVEDVKAAYVREKMADVPKAYLSGLGDDPAKFADAEQVIRKQVKADLAAAGLKVPNLGGSSGGQSVLAAMDLSKLSPAASIAAGLAERGRSAPSA